MGECGEMLVFALERRCLDEIGRPDLAAKVVWVSQERGDGDGYDILSFDDAGGRKFIEVKTTNGGERAAFYISANELQFAEQHSGNYWLYRLYSFSSAPKLY